MSLVCSLIVPAPCSEAKHDLLAWSIHEKGADVSRKLKFCYG